MFIILEFLLYVGVLWIVYLKGFRDCMYGNREHLFEVIRKTHIDKFGEDPWADD